jgi:hypothetical protein
MIDILLSSAAQLTGEDPMPPIDIICHVDFDHLTEKQKTKLRREFEDKIKHLKEVISALNGGLEQLKQKSK